MIRDWEIHIHFKVHGQNSRFYGDGFAFWYAKDKSVEGLFYYSLVKKDLYSFYSCDNY